MTGSQAGISLRRDLCPELRSSAGGDRKECQEIKQLDVCAVNQGGFSHSKRHRFW